MSIWTKGVLGILVVWAVGVSLFLAVNTLHERDQGHRLWCLEVGVTTLQIGVGRLAGTVNDNVISMQAWAGTNELLYSGGRFPPKQFFYPPDDTLLTFTDPSSDVTKVCERQEEFGL